MIIENSILLTSVTELVDLIMILLFLSSFIRIKHEPAWFWAACFSAYAVMCYVLNSFSSYVIYSYILFITALVCFTVFLSESSDIRKIICIALSLLLLFSIKFSYNTIVIDLLLGLPSDLTILPVPIRIFIAITSRLMLLALVILIRNRQAVRSFSVPQSTLLFLCIVFSGVFFSLLTVQIASGSLFDDYIALCCIFLCLQSVSYICMFLSIKKRDDALRENAVTIQKLEGDQKQYQKDGEYIKQLEIWKHDMKKHLQSLLSMTDSSPDKERIQNYISEIQEGLEHTQTFVDTGNLLFDSIVSANSSSAVSKGIAVQLEIIVPRLVFMNDVDLSSILSNMWENAIESCIRVREGGTDTASICFRTFVSNNHFVMELSNTCIPNESGELQSGKTGPGHGIGLNVIRKLTDKHNGICGFRAEDDTFISRVAIPVNTDHADGIDDCTVFNWNSVK